MQKTVIDTISHYADKGDLQTAALIVLVFYNLLHTVVNPTEKKDQAPIVPFESFISRIIVSYLELLKSLELYSHATEVIKYGP